MKRLLHFFIALLFTGSGLLAQGVQVNVSGTVTDTNNMPIANHPVHIMTDSAFAQVSYSTTVYTNPNGFYQASFFLQASSPIPLVLVTPGCNGMVMIQNVVYMNSPVVVNFVLCANNPPPPCSNSFTWTVGILWNTYTFSGQVIPQGNATYVWNFGDGTNGTGQFVQHTYAAPGTYVVTLTTVSGGCTANSTQTIQVGQPISCQAMFSASPTPVNNLTWIFNNMSLGGPNLNFYWSFGDGSHSTAPNPTHTYLQGGPYAVCLSIMDSAANCFDTYCDTIFVGNTSTPCHSNFNQQVNGLNVVLSGYMINPGPAVYNWDFGDNTTGTGQNVTHTYSQPGVYFVCLTTITPNACSFTSCHQIFVGGQPGCQAHYIWMPDSNGTGAIFMDASLGNPSTWHWSFGDGTFSNQQNPGLHLYNGTGPYYVCLTISDSLTNCQSTYCDTIFLPNPNCLSHFSYSASAMNALTLTFNGFTSMPNPSFQWDFGDGTFGTGQTVSHTYLQGGLYQVCMKVSGGGIICPPVCQNVFVGGGNPGTASVAGIVFTFNTPADYGQVFLIEYDSVANTLTALDTVPLDSMGHFFFHNVPFGHYFLKAALLPTSTVYSGYLPTYYGNSLTWNYAQYIHVGAINPTVLTQIQLIAGANPGGPGFIGGSVLNGANKLLGEGDPIEGVEVMIMDMTDNPIAYAWSNSNGIFSIPNLPYGTYKVYAEIPGLNTTPGIVTLDASNPSNTSIQITVTSTQVITGFGQVSESVEFIGQAFPNPTSDQVSIEMGMSKSTLVHFKVLDQSGRIVKSFDRAIGAGSAIQEFDLKDLNAGFYMLSIQTADGAKVVRNLVKM